MQLLQQKVLAGDIYKMIEARLESITDRYNYAKGGNKEQQAMALAEAKWHMAELKMQFADLLCKQLEDSDTIKTN